MIHEMCNFNAENIHHLLVLAPFSALVKHSICGQGVSLGVYLSPSGLQPAMQRYEDPITDLKTPF
jgi:hypothetical protein